MPDVHYPHGGNLPIPEALRLINSGELPDLPVPEELTFEQVQRGIQLDSNLGRTHFKGEDPEYPIKDLGMCCARFCVPGDNPSDLSSEELAAIKSDCPGLTFAGISRVAITNSYVIALACPPVIDDSKLPRRQRIARYAEFTPQQVPDGKIDRIIDTLTPKTPEDVFEMVRIVLKRYQPRNPVETYYHQEARRSRTAWASGEGQELQRMIFGIEEQAESILGDDFSINSAARFIAERVEDRITKPGGKFTARHFALSLAHLAATYARASRQPREV